MSNNDFLARHSPGSQKGLPFCPCFTRYSPASLFAIHLPCWYGPHLRAASMRLYLTPERFYAVTVQRDLFGERVIVRCWGGRGSRRGGMASEPFTPGRLAEIDNSRRAHHYELS